MIPQFADPDLPESLKSLLRKRTAEGPCPSAAVVAGFVQDTLAPAYRVAFLAHLAECRACADEVLETRELLLMSPAAVRSGKRPGTRVTRRTQRPARPVPSFPWAWVAAAAVAVVALLYVVTRPDETRAPSHVAATPRPAPAPAPHLDPRGGETPAVKPPEPKVKEPSDTLEPEAEPPKVAENPPPQPPEPGDTMPLGEALDVTCVAGATEGRSEGEREWLPLAAGSSMTFAKGNLGFRAGGDRAARIYSAGCVLSAEGRSEVALTRDGRRLRLSLDRGTVLVDAGARRAAEVELRTAGAVVDGPNLHCAVRVEGDNADVVALDRDVTVESGGGTVRVTKGDQLRVSRGRVPGAAPAADTAAFLGWTKDVEALVTAEAEGGKASAIMTYVRDAKASGGQYLSSPRQKKQNEEISVEVAFDADRDGEYRILARIAPGDYKHTDGSFRFTVDAGKKQFMHVHGSGDEWQWAELEGTVRLAKGRHTVRIQDPWGGHWIDSVLATTAPWYWPPGAERKDGGKKK